MVAQDDGWICSWGSLAPLPYSERAVNSTCGEDGKDSAVIAIPGKALVPGGRSEEKMQTELDSKLWKLLLRLFLI